MAGAQFQMLLATTPPGVIGTPVSLGSAQGSASASSVTLTTLAAIPAGALAVVGVVAGFGTAQTITGVSDGTNTYTRAAGAVWDATGDFVVDIWYKENAAAVSSGATLTATFSAAALGGTNVPIICAAYATGIQSASSLDKTNSGKQEPGTACASGTTGTLTQAKELVIGFAGGSQNVTSISEGSGFTQSNQRLQGAGNNWAGNLAYQIVTATTALNYQPTFSNSFSGAVIATFKGI
jgi:hypothetical protein